MIFSVYTESLTSGRRNLCQLNHGIRNRKGIRCCVGLHHRVVLSDTVPNLEGCTSQVGCGQLIAPLLTSIVLHGENLNLFNTRPRFHAKRARLIRLGDIHVLGENLPKDNSRAINQLINPIIESIIDCFELCFGHHKFCGSSLRA